MAAKKTAPQADARRRAREAKARLDASRRDHDQKVEDVTTRFYEIQSQYQAALTEAEHLRAKREQHDPGARSANEQTPHANSN